jgi:hypothetical protein
MDTVFWWVGLIVVLAGGFGLIMYILVWLFEFTLKQFNCLWYCCLYVYYSGRFHQWLKENYPEEIQS